MKIIFAIVRDADDANVIDQLITSGFRVTRVASTGGFLRRGNVTLLIGVEGDQHVQTVVDMLREVCGPADPDQHRATVFVVNAEHYEQF
jgi:uncharacterized protein YaaQ